MTVFLLGARGRLLGKSILIDFDFGTVFYLPMIPHDPISFDDWFLLVLD